MKKMILLTFIVLLLTNCSSDETSNEQNTDLQNDEFVLLIPASSQITSIEINNDFYTLYKDQEDNLNKLSKINNRGEVLWTKEILTNLTLNNIDFMTYDNIHLFFYNRSETGSFNLYKFDLEGNLLNTSLLSNESFDSAQIKQNSFYLIKQSPTSIYSEEFSLSGNLLNTFTNSISIEDPNYSKTIIKNNKSFVFNLSVFNGSALGFYENYNCDVYENNTLLSSLEIAISNSRGDYLNSLVLDNENVLLITRSQANGTELKLFDHVTGNNIENRIFNGLDDVDTQVFLMQDGNIGLVSSTSSNISDIKNSQFVILDPNLNIVSEKFFGGFDFTDIRYKVYESNNGNYYYITGNTFSTDGDYSNVPENPDTLDMFIFKLSK